MKKNIFKAAALTLAGAFGLFSCGRSDSDTVTPSGNIKSLNINLTDADNTKDNYQVKVNPSDGSVKFVITLQHAGDVDKILMLKSTDGGEPVKVDFLSSQDYVKDSKDSTVRHKLGHSSNGYTVKIDGKAQNSTTKETKSTFTVELPVQVSGVKTNEVYQIWATNGDGSFKKVDRNKVLGAVKVFVVYDGTTPVGNIISFNASVGNSSSSKPSYVTTFGTGGVLYGSMANVEANAPKLTDENGVTIVDSSYFALGEGASIVDIYVGALTKDKKAIGSDSASFISPDVRESLNTANDGKFDVLTNTTKFGKVASTFDFAAAGSPEIAALTTPTLDRVSFKQGDVIVFLTEDGRKGVAKITTISGNDYTIAFKVQGE